MQYKRVFIKGGTYFFTVVTHKRKKIFHIPDNVEKLRNCFRHVMKNHPFTIDAIVLLPDHLHCLWTLPEDDFNYPKRWQLIKSGFTRTYNNGNNSAWQNRFWEHTIRDDNDFVRHLDYIHYNPVKHGYASAPSDWANSSFHKYVKLKKYAKTWDAGIHLKFGNDVGME